MNRRERRAQRHDPRLDGAEVRYGGRTLELRVFVNTDEDVSDVLMRIQKAVKSGPKSPMVAILIGEPQKGHEAETFWKATIALAKQQSDREGGTPS